MEFAAADLIALGAGGLIGLTLGLVGAGGSILAVPLLVYAVGIASPHVAIGTGAVAVAAGYGHTCAVLPAQPSGSGPDVVSCWGDGTEGRLARADAVG
ncbi:MAG: hypothetical protein ACK4S3_08515, partial [Parvibaculum sp.]